MYLDSIDDYDTVILAYPNYWGTIPMAVATFLERYDFTGKTILPLCTNEGSGMGGSKKTIRQCAPGADVKKGLPVICGDCYNPNFPDYVFVDEMGNLYRPNMVSDSFAALLKKHGLRKIRFHDIRHSCASLLKNGVNLKLIQEWLGHSDISTTMNIYAHLDTTAKDVSAAAMSQALSLPDWGGGYGWQRSE